MTGMGTVVRSSVGSGAVQVDLINEDMFAKIKKEDWTGRGATHLFAEHVAEGKGAGQVFALQHHPVRSW